MDLALFITVIGVLVAVTNVVTEVLKKATWDKLPTNILAFIVAEALTLAAGFAYCQIEAVAIMWYTVIAFVVAGFMVAYAAMFGFDKLKEIMDWSDTNE